MIEIMIVNKIEIENEIESVIEIEIESVIVIESASVSTSVIHCCMQASEGRGWSGGTGQEKTLL